MKTSLPAIADAGRVRFGATFKLLPKAVADANRVRTGATFQLIRSV